MKEIPVKIEHGVKKPEPTSRWSVALKQLKVDDSFVYTGKSVSNMYIYAKCVGISISTSRLDDGTFRVWRTE